MKNQSAIRVHGGGRFLLSDKTEGNDFTLTVEQSGRKPVTLSIPSGVELKKEQVTLDEKKLSLKLQGKVDLPFEYIVDQENGSTTRSFANVDLEIRGEDGKPSRTMPLMRDGKFMYKSTEDMLKKYEEERQAIRLDSSTHDFNTIEVPPLTNIGLERALTYHRSPSSGSTPRR